jgi:hypothetical protein
MRPLVSAVAFLLLALLIAKRVRVSSRDVSIISGFGAILAVQAVSLGTIGVLSVLGFIAKLLTAFAVVRLIRNFAKVYVDAMFWTATISFPFFALMIATQGRIASMVEPLSFKVPDPFFLVHYFASPHLLQNNSYFWEPGVFAGYLVVALIFLGGVREQYSFRRYRLIVFVLLAAVASTRSTGGYLMAPLAMVFHGKAMGKNIVVRAVPVMVAIAGLIFVYTSSDFLGKKISNQFEEVQGQGNGWQLTRLGSLLYDFRLIKERPLIGWGPDPDLQNAVVDQVVTHREGNGLSKFTASFGFIGVALFMATTWVGFRNLFHGKTRLATLALIIIVGMLNDEPFLSFSLFMTLMFLRRPVLGTAGSSSAARYAPDGPDSVGGHLTPAVSGPLNPVI